MQRATTIESTNRWPSEREVQRAQASREESVERLTWAIRDDGTTEPLPELRLRRASAPTGLGHGVSFPSFCVIAQGSKEVLLGDSRYRYNPAHYLISTAALPIASRITEASPERPYLASSSSSTRPWSARCMVEAGLVHRGTIRRDSHRCEPAGREPAGRRGAAGSAAGLPDRSALFRAAGQREIVYRLLMGAQGGRLVRSRPWAAATHRIAEAIERLRNDFDQPLRIEDLARELGMSVSGFHHHFRAVTAMSPLQFQKQLRLQEARRLMLGEDLDAASAGYRVGYDDASHFTREYKRLFGDAADARRERLREGASERVGQQHFRSPCVIAPLLHCVRE